MTAECRNFKGSGYFVWPLDPITSNTTKRVEARACVDPLVFAVIAGLIFAFDEHAFHGINDPNLGPWNAIISLILILA